MDLDGIPDILIGSQSSVGSYGGRVYSGATGAELFSLPRPGTVVHYGSVTYFDASGAGDVNADGHPDVVIAATGDLFVISGKDGSTIHHVMANQHGLTYIGSAVGYAGDWNQDGYADYFAGCQLSTLNQGAALIFSGKDATVLAQFDSGTGDYKFAATIAHAGDINLDGYPDLLVGHTGNRHSGGVLVYSERTGPMLYRIKPPPEAAGSTFGKEIAGNADLDGDKIPDIVVGDRLQNGTGGGTGAVYVFSGLDGKLRYHLKDPGPDGWLGAYVCTISDLDRDGLAEFVSGANQLDRVLVHAFKPYLFATARTLSTSSGGVVKFPIDFPETEAGFPYALLVSESGTGPTTVFGTELPLTEDWRLRRSLNGSGHPELGGAYGVLDAEGNGFGWIRLAPGSALNLLGRSLYGRRHV